MNTEDISFIGQLSEFIYRHSSGLFMDQPIWEEDMGSEQNSLFIFIDTIHN